MKKALLPYTIEMVSTDVEFKAYVLRRGAKTQSAEAVAYALSRYCSHVGMMPTELISEAKREEKTIDDVYKRKVTEYIQEFADFLREAPSNTKNGLSDSTISQIRNRVMRFYKSHGVELPDIRIRVGRPQKANRHFTNKDEIKKALSLCTNPRDRAIILCQASSGMGTAELLSVTTQQFKRGLDENGICSLELVRKKTGRPFITFLSPEATEQVSLWLENYDGKKLFPLTDDGIQQMYGRINERLGYEKEYGQFTQFRSHAMRRFFNNAMFDNGRGMHKDLIWFMSGRAENSTQEGYIDKTIEELKELYTEHVEKISVSKVKNITSERVKMLEEEIQMIKEHMQGREEVLQALASIEDEKLRRMVLAVYKGDYSGVPEDLRKKFNV